MHPKSHGRFNWFQSTGTALNIRREEQSTKNVLEEWSKGPHVQYRVNSLATKNLGNFQKLYLMSGIKIWRFSNVINRKNCLSTAMIRINLTWTSKWETQIRCTVIKWEEGITCLTSAPVLDKNVEISLNDRTQHFSIAVKVTSLSYNNSQKVQSPLFFNNLGSWNIPFAFSTPWVSIYDHKCSDSLMGICTRCSGITPEISHYLNQYFSSMFIHFCSIFISEKHLESQRSVW